MTVVPDTTRPVFIAEADGVHITVVGYGSEATSLITCENPVFEKRVRMAATFGYPVEYVWGVSIYAGWETPEGIIAALLAAAPGRTRILRAPAEALAVLDRRVPPTDPNVIY